MNLLALETATEHCSVALLRSAVDGSHEVLVRRLHAPRQQTELILPMIDEVLAESGLRLNQLDGLAYSRGPGAFTGVRIAAAVAQGLALGADLGVVPVSSLQALAQGAWRATGAEAVLASFDARMQEVYAGAFLLGAEGSEQEGLMQPQTAEVAARPEALPEALVLAWSAMVDAALSPRRAATAVGAGSGWGGRRSLRWTSPAGRLWQASTRPLRRSRSERPEPPAMHTMSRGLSVRRWARP